MWVIMMKILKVSHYFVTRERIFRNNRPKNLELCWTISASERKKGTLTKIIGIYIIGSLEEVLMSLCMEVLASWGVLATVLSFLLLNGITKTNNECVTRKTFQLFSTGKVNCFSEIYLSHGRLCECWFDYKTWMT